MYKELERGIGELRVNHTDAEITDIFSKYVKILKDILEDYDDQATLADVRADHPELGFMDDRQIEGILGQAKMMCQKREPDEDKYLPLGSIKELFERNRSWFDIGSEIQQYWAKQIETSVSIEEMAGIVWICTKNAEETIDKIKRTMREYMAEKREKEQEDLKKRREELYQKIKDEMARRRGIEDGAWRLIAEGEHEKAAKLLKDLDDNIIKGLQEEYGSLWGR